LHNLQLLQEKNNRLDLGYPHQPPSQPSASLGEGQQVRSRASLPNSYTTFSFSRRRTTGKIQGILTNLLHNLQLLQEKNNR
jgi:hypothetical protein